MVELGGGGSERGLDSLKKGHRKEGKQGSWGQQPNREKNRGSSPFLKKNVASKKRRKVAKNANLNNPFGRPYQIAKGGIPATNTKKIKGFHICRKKQRPRKNCKYKRSLR